MGKLIFPKKIQIFSSAIDFAIAMEKEKVLALLDEIQEGNYLDLIKDEESSYKDIKTRIQDTDCDIEVIEEYVKRHWEDTYIINYPMDGTVMIIEI